MNLNQVTLPCTDVARGAAFYRRLGFRQIVEDLPEYARFECPVGTATFSLHRVDRVPADTGFVVYFECEDLDATVARLERVAGVRMDVAPTDQPWLWREAYVRDPDGNTICLFHAGTIRHFPPWRLKTTDEAAHAAAGEGTAPAIVIEEDPDPLDIDALGTGLREHSQPITTVPGFKPLAVFARDDAGTVLGGIFALHNWNWLQINYVWVAEPLRGTGLGHRLLVAIEDAGRARGCTRAHLDTFSFQARPFYERHGYEVFGTLDDYPPGEQRFYLRKTL